MGAAEPKGSSPVNRIFAVLAVAAGLYGLLISLIAPALPTLAHSLNVNLASANWLFIAFLLSSAVTTPIIGRLGDVIGKKRMLVVVTAVVAVGLLISALATSLLVMVVGRAIQGVLGGVVPLCFGILRDEFPPAMAATGFGMISGFLGVGTGLGLVTAGPILRSLDYHWLFWMPMAVVVAVGLVVAIVVPGYPGRAKAGINWVGAALMCIWVTTLLLAISLAPSRGWGDPAVLALLGVTPVLVVLWIRSETNSAHPLVDLEMMRLPAVWRTNLVSVLLGNGLFACAIIIPAFMETPASTGFGFGASPSQVGYYLLPIPIGTLMFSMLNPSMTRRFGAKKMLILSTAFVMAAYVSFPITYAESWSPFLVCALVGIGSGLGFSAMPNLIVNAVSPSQSGIAAGMNGNARLLGQVLGSAMVTTIIASAPTVGGFPGLNGYLIAASACAVLMLIALAFAFAVPAADRARALPTGSSAASAIRPT